LGPTCYSFGDSKILRIGEGGMLCTNDAHYADLVRLARHQGEAWMTQGGSRTQDVDPTVSDALVGLASCRLGLNYRPCAISAAVGLAQLRDIKRIRDRLSDNATTLITRLSRHDSVLKPLQRDERCWWTFPIAVEEQRLKRDVLLAALLAEGIPVGVHFPRILADNPIIRPHLLNENDNFNNAKSFARSHLVLPIYCSLTVEHISLVCDAIDKVLPHVIDAPSELERYADEYLSKARIKELCSGLFFFCYE
jgi:dTDP-4-amino-4,6-dideoxygalactose transaminase